MQELMQRLNYRFKEEGLLEVALTTPSLGSEKRLPDYQRLEFLGDSVLQLAVSRHLFLKYPQVKEGKLTFARAKLVREETLYQAAREIGLGQFIRITAGMEKEGARDNPSILSDVVEAIIAAVYLDGGMEEASALVGRLLQKPLSGNPFEQILDAKSQLNILSQQKGGHTPEYRIVRSEGTAPHQTFTAQVIMDGQVMGEADGPSKQAAQQAAAKIAINRINERQCNPCD